MRDLMPATLRSTAVLSPAAKAKFRLIAATLPSVEINQPRNNGSSRMRRAAASSSAPSLLRSGETSSRPAVQRGSAVDSGLSMAAQTRALGLHQKQFSGPLKKLMYIKHYSRCSAQLKMDQVLLKRIYFDRSKVVRRYISQYIKHQIRFSTN